MPLSSLWLQGAVARRLEETGELSPHPRLRCVTCAVPDHRRLESGKRHPPAGGEREANLSSDSRRPRESSFIHFRWADLTRRAYVKGYAACQSLKIDIAASVAVAV